LRRHGATEADEAGERVLGREPRRVEPVVAGRRAEVPHPGLAGAGEQAHRWWRAAEPKSHTQGSPAPVSRHQRVSLSRAHSPMTVLEIYRMLCWSKTSSAPSPEPARAWRTRPRR